MYKWENKDEYLKHLDFKHEEAKKQYISPIKKKNSNYQVKKNLDIQLNSNPDYLNKAKMMLSDELHIHIYENDLDLNFLDIILIMHTKELVDFFIERNYSLDRNEFDREIEQHKKNADKLMKNSMDPIRIYLPFMSTVSVRMLIYYFEISKTEESEITNILDFFKMRKPRKDNVTTIYLIDICNIFSKKILSENNSLSFDNIKCSIKNKIIDTLQYIAK